MIDKSILYLIDYLKNNEKFDGLCGFSQGAGTVTTFYKLLQHQRKHLNIYDGLVPRFNILFSLPAFKFMNYTFRGNFFTMGGLLIAPDGNPLDCLHITNNRKPEPYWWYMQSYYHCESSTPVILHKESHNPPRNLTLP